MIEIEKVRVRICPHCGNVDDLEPLVQTCEATGEKTLESRRCPCNSWWERS